MPRKDYNIMLIGLPDTEQRVNDLKKYISESLEEEVLSEIIPFKKFTDGSWNAPIKNSVRGKNVYFYHDHFSNHPEEKGYIPDISSRYLLGMEIRDAIVRSDPHTVNLIYPKTPFARSDKDKDSGMAHTTEKTSKMAFKVIQDIKDDGVDRYITIDIHNPTVMGALDGRPSHGVNLGYGWLIKKVIDDIVLTQKIPIDIKDKSKGLTEEQLTKELSSYLELISTDLGGAKKTSSIAQYLNINNAVGDKTRDQTNPQSNPTVKLHKNEAKITDMHLLTYDDMLDTGGTIAGLEKRLGEETPKSTSIVTTHGLFNGEARNLLSTLHAEGKLDKLYITDSVFRKDPYPDYVEVIKTDRIIGEAIVSIAKKKPVDYNFFG